MAEKLFVHVDLGAGEKVLAGQLLVDEQRGRFKYARAFIERPQAVHDPLGGLAEIQRRHRLSAGVQQHAGGAGDVLRLVHDRMTECPYPVSLETFEHGIEPEPVRTIPVLEHGRLALERVNREMGLAFDEWDLDYYTQLFVEQVGRDPTDVELFDIAQSNSEHSRHWFFKGRLVIDGTEAPRNLMELLRAPLDANPGNSVIAFKDNSSGIRGYRIRTLMPEFPGEPGRMVPAEADYHVIFTAETHNFPSGVAPFSRRKVTVESAASRRASSFTKSTK